jgi:F0F1-type ATP synthase assembly protein I
MEKKNNDLWQALNLLGQLGYIIAIPLVVLALLGRFLDKKYDTSPWLLIVGMFFSLMISSVWVYKKSAEIMAAAIDNDKKDKKDEKL